MVGIDKEIYGFRKKRTWINSIVRNSICQKTKNKSIGTTLSMLKIYSSCLICILKVKYTKFKLFPLLYTRFVCLTACQTAGLPAVRPGSTIARASVFSHNNGNHVGFTKPLFRRTFIIYPLRHGASFYPLLVSFRLQIAYGKVRNSRICVNKLVG